MSLNTRLEQSQLDEKRNKETAISFAMINNKGYIIIAQLSFKTCKCLESPIKLVSTTRSLSLTILRELPSFSTSPRLLYSDRIDAAAGRDVTTST